jgi:hypothetical protein
MYRGFKGLKAVFENILEEAKGEENLVIDSSGHCLFIAFAILDIPSGFEGMMEECNGVLGTSWKVRKLQVTAITMRKNKPIYYTPLAAGLEYSGFDLLREATFFELAEMDCPGYLR